MQNNNTGIDCEKMAVIASKSIIISKGINNIAVINHRMFFRDGIFISNQSSDFSSSIRLAWGLEM